jgi:hypothetical protein
VETIEVGGVPHELPLSCDILDVTDRERGVLRRLHIGEWAELPAVEAGEWPYAVVALRTGDLVIADAASSALLLGSLRVPTTELPETVVVSSEGTRIASALFSAGAIWLVDGAGAVRRVAIGGLPDGLLYEDGTLYAGDLSTGRLSAIDPRVGRVIARYKVGAAG